jgi:AcrR family transcriptional regulator
MRKPLGREQIVDAAFQLLDAAGIEGVSLRKVACQLGIRAPSLYWHFKSKQALVDAMADALIEDVARDIPAGQSWRATLRQVAHEFRRGARRTATARASMRLPASQARTCCAWAKPRSRRWPRPMRRSASPPLRRWTWPMMPIARGFSGDSSFRAPMAIAVIGGLIASTLLSLIVIPAAFTVVDDLGE